MKKLLFIDAIGATSMAATAQPPMSHGAPPSAKQKLAHTKQMLQKEVQLSLTQTTTI